MFPLSTGYLNIELVKSLGKKRKFAANHLVKLRDNDGVRRVVVHVDVENLGLWS